MVLFHDFELLIVLQKVDSGSKYSQLSDLDHVNKAGDDGFVSEIKSLDALEVPQIPNFYFAFVVTRDDHWSFFYENEIGDEVFVAQEFSFQIGIEVSVVDLKDVDFLFEACTEENLISFGVMKSMRDSHVVHGADFGDFFASKVIVKDNFGFADVIFGGIGLGESGFLGYGENVETRDFADFVNLTFVLALNFPFRNLLFQVPNVNRSCLITCNPGLKIF